MKINTLKKIFDFLFPKRKDVTSEIFNLLKNRIIYYPKNKLIFFFPYKNNLIKNQIWDMKFKKNFSVAKIFGKVIYENLPEVLRDLEIQSDFNNPILVSIPISFSRKVSRGYDQNYLMIKSFYNLGGKNFIHWEKGNLKKIKNTIPQSKTKNRKERLLNIKNSFLLKNPERILGKNILVFDDVLTTGATLNEARKVLKKAGAKKIIFMVIAH